MTEREVLDRPKLTVENLRFHYGDFLALNGIDVAIPDRRVTAVVGPSGCGKSTFLRVFNRIYQLYPGQRADGRVLLDGIDILGDGMNLARLRARVGMVFQKPTPFPMSIYDNVAFGVRLHERIPRREMDRRVEWSLMKAGLWDEVKDDLKRSGLALSGGQQQRLCIARAIAVKPEVILLDEPASALDPASASRVEDLVCELRRDYCIVVVTHNLQQAARISDYAAFMYLGELVEFAETDVLFTRPSDPRTLKFVTGRFG